LSVRGYTLREVRNDAAILKTGKQYVLTASRTVAFTLKSRRRFPWRRQSRPISTSSPMRRSAK
jgi:hypothetical protein